MTDDPFAQDKLSRRPDAELLTKLIVSEPRPAVLSVDAPWGGGKTTFVRMWGALLGAVGHPVVYYNAWETDFVDDPLIAFIGEIEESLSELKDGISSSPDLKRHWRRLRALGVSVIRSTGPLAVRVATQGILQVDDVRSALGFVSDAKSEIGAFAAKITEERLAAYQKEKAAARAFRDTLAQFAQELTQEGRGVAPLVVFVDELDRCRPSFAIALLERVKHLFTVPGVVFVLSLDKEQLAQTVKSVYGSGFAAEGYLRRFIDYDYRLPMPQGKAFVEYLAEKHQVIDIYRASEASAAEHSSVIPNFVQLSRIFQLSLRDQEQSFQRIVLALKSAESPRHYLYTNLMIFLGVLRFGDSSLYHKYMAGTSGVRDLLEAVRDRVGGAKYLDSHSGVVCQAYLVLSARRDSDAKEILEQATKIKENPNASQETRTAAAGLLEMAGHVRQAGGAHALKAALFRLEKINQQIDVPDYD